MAGRRLNAEDWSPVNQTRIRASLEPREERLRLPASKSERALRPKPLNVPSRKPSPLELKAPPPSRKESIEVACDSPREPEIVDVAPPGTWPRRDSPAQRSQRRIKSPSIASYYSSRQSEISLGIIDYYMREPTPSVYSPELPPPPTPKLDPAIDKFDFGLPATPTPSLAPTVPELPPAQENKEQPLIPISPPAVTARPAAPAKGYSLFPAIKEVTPPPPTRQNTTITLIDPLTPTQEPSPTYRPRKESLTTRKRAESLISPNNSIHCTRKPIPLRLLSSDSSTPRADSALSNYQSRTTSTSSPPYHCQSRWSDDTTLTSPTSAQPIRTSFGSMLHRRETSLQTYSFFEDDEEVSLRQKFAWKKSSTSSYGSGKASERGGSGWRWVFCGCAGRKGR